MINLINVSKVYNPNSKNEFVALKKINFSVKMGEIFALKGKSGSGKSTLLSLICGLDKPSSGEIIIENESITTLSIKFMSEFRRKNIGFIFQNFNLIPTISVIDNILLPVLPDGAIEKKEFANELLDKFELYDKKNQKAKDLSGGEMQRVAMIRAVINNPKIILADEPTANLDKKLTHKLLDFFLNLQNQNKTIIVATHDFEVLNSKIITNSYEIGR